MLSTLYLRCLAIVLVVLGATAAGALLGQAAGAVARAGAERQVAAAEALALRLEDDLARWEREAARLAAALGRAEARGAPLRPALDAARRGEVLWAGLLGLDGRLRAATGGLRPAERLAALPWFQTALAGGGGVPVASRGAGGGPLARMDLLQPVSAPGGETAGLLALRLDWAALGERLAARAEAAGLAVAVIGRDGAPALGTGEAAAAAPAAALRAAAGGWAGHFSERRATGPVAAAVRPISGSGFGASLGWSLVATAPAPPVLGPALHMAAPGLLAWLAATLLCLAIGRLFARRYLAPISESAAAAWAISEGEGPAIPQSRATREAERLNTALEKILVRLEWHEGGPRDMTEL